MPAEYFDLFSGDNLGKRNGSFVILAFERVWYETKIADSEVLLKLSYTESLHVHQVCM